jgi:hypothetical protein
MRCRPIHALLTLLTIALVAPSLAGAACATGKCTSPAAVEDVRGLIAAACDCSGATTKRSYLRCAKDVLRGALRDGTLPKACRSGVWGCEVQSTCGLPSASICCVQRGAKVKAKLLGSDAKCRGNMCRGARSVAEACSAEATCREERRGIRAFRSVQKVFSQSCALPSCHSTFARKGGLVLDTEDVSYVSLVDRLSVHPQATGRFRVKPGDPAASFLVQKLHGEGPGDVMPPGAPPLSAAVIEMVEDWIDRGAKTTAEECNTAGNSARCEPDTTPIGDYQWVPQEPLAPPPAGTGVQMFVPRKDVAPGSEWETCYAFRMSDILAAQGFPPGTLATVKQQTYRMHAGSHHLLLYAYFGANPEQYKFDRFFDCFAGSCLNPGDCPADGYLKIPMGGTQVAGTRYDVVYPNGVGVPLLGSDPVIIANLHYTNPFQPQQPVYSEAWINLYFHQPGEFKAVLDGVFAINFPRVEPYQRRTMSRIWQPRGLITRQPVDAAIFNLFGHMHKRGIEFTIDYLKGAQCSGSGAVCSRDSDCPTGETCNKGPNAEDSTVYYTTSWDHAPVVDFPAPYFRVGKDEGLRWTCTHVNGIEGDPLHPPRRCAEFGCDAVVQPDGTVAGDDCAWDPANRQCIFEGDPPRIFAEGEPMPLVFGELADDDMCNMFGYFVDQQSLPLIGVTP